MKVTKMQTRAFWKGEFRIDGLVEDQGITYKVSLGEQGQPYQQLLLFLCKWAFL